MKNKLQKIVSGATAFAVTAFVAGNAVAGDLATAVTGGLDTAELMLIGAAVLTATGVIVMIRKGGKAANA